MSKASGKYRPAVEGLEGRWVPSGAAKGATTHHIMPPLLDGSGGVVSGTDPQPQSAESIVAQANHVTDVTDPRIAREGDAYYLFSTGAGIPVRTSTDLVHWEPAGTVFQGVPAWALAKVPGAESIWAPDIAYFDGQYHLYYAVSDYATNRSVIGLATSPTLDPAGTGGRWVDQGEVIESHPHHDPWNAIDPAIAFDAGGQPWLAFGSQWGGVKLLAIDPTTGKAAGGARPALSSLAARPGGKPIEAPYIISHDGYYYLFVSFDKCCQGSASTYKIMVGRSTRIDGPYLDRAGKPMMKGGGTLVLAGDGHYQGPGHNEVFRDGGQDWLVYHTYDAQLGGTPILQIRPLAWDGSGWPVPGPPLP